MMKVNITEVDIKQNSNDGNIGIVYYKREKFTGIVYEKNEKFVIWEFYVNNGLQNGIEKVYNEETGKLEQVSEYEDNFQSGVSIEYNDKENINSISVVWNNGYLKSLLLNNGKILEIEDVSDIIKYRYPEYIYDLLSIPNIELVKKYI